MQKIGIIVAMTKEFELLKGKLEKVSVSTVNGSEMAEGFLGGKKTALMQCGIGKVCAAVGTTELIKFLGPDCIINTGVAGGISSETKVMDVVAGSRLVYHDVWCGEPNAYGQVQGLPAFFASEAALLKKAAQSECGVRIHEGLICSGDQFITSRGDLENIRQKFPDALAVDMESAAVAQVCHIYGVPFLSLRIISDTPGVENHQKQYYDFWKQAPEKLAEIVEKTVGLL